MRKFNADGTPIEQANPNGQATMANSQPVVLASDQSAVPVSAASLPLPAGAATSANQTALLTELQLKADLTETQPVSLASVPSHAVTNAGTFAVQSDIVKVNGIAVNVGIGAAGTGTQRVAVASDSSVTANAGTNLNTSALATSAKQDTLLTELQLKADLTETQPVSLASVPSHPVTNAGTFAVQSDIAKVNAVAVNVGTGAAGTGTQRVAVASDSSIVLAAGSALAGKVGIDQTTPGTTNAVSTITGQAGVAANTGFVSATTQRTTAAYNTDWITLRTNFTAAQTDAALVTAAGGQRIVVRNLDAMTDHANAVDVAVRIGFGATVTPTAAGVLLTHPGIAPGSGLPKNYGPDGIVGADGEDLRITSEVPTGGSLDTLVVYKIV
jgi:hypothetical protein